MSGSGTTLAAAKQLKRKWWGCDIDKEAVAISRQRLMNIDNAGDGHQCGNE